MSLRACILLVLILTPALAGCLGPEPEADIGVRIISEADQAYKLEATFYDAANASVGEQPFTLRRGEVLRYQTPLEDGRYNVTFTLTHGPGSNHDADQGELAPTNRTVSARGVVDGTTCRGLAVIVLLVQPGPVFKVADQDCVTG